MPKPSFSALIWTVILSGALSIQLARGEGVDSKQLLVPAGETLPVPMNLLALPSSRFDTLAFSHDGRLLASAAKDGRVCLWDLATARPRRSMMGLSEKPVGTLAWSSHDTWLAAGQEDGQVELWHTDGATVTPPCSIEALSAEPALGRAISALLFTKSALATGAELLAIGGRNRAVRSCTARFDDATARDSYPAQKPHTLPALIGLPGTLFDRSAIDAKGEAVAISKDRMVGVWELRSGNRRWMEESLQSRVTSLAMSPDGRRLAAGMLDGSIAIWSVADGGQRRLRKHHRGAVRILAFSPDGTRLAAAGPELHVSLWDADSLEHETEFAREAPIDAVAFSEDGARLAVSSADVGISVFSVATGAVVQVLSGNADKVRSVAFGPQGTLLATASEDRQVRLFHRRAEGNPEWSLLCTAGPLGGAVRALAFRPPEGQVLTATTESGAVAFLRTEDCAQLGSPVQLGDFIPPGPKPLSYSPDGRWLALGTQSGELLVWNSETPSLSRRWKAHGDEVRAVAFLPSGSPLLASGSFDKKVTLWDVTSGKEVSSFEPQAAGIRALAIRPDGKQLAMAVGKEVSLWEMATRQKIATFSHEQLVTAVRFSPDGSLLGTTTDAGTTQLFDVSSQKLVTSLPAVSDRTAAWALDFSPGGELLAVASLGRVNLWQPKSFALHGQLLLGRTDWAYWQADSPTGKLFRHDSGALLWTKEAGGTIAPLWPPRPDVPAQLSLRVEVRPGTTLNPLYAQLVAHIHNTATSGPAYWVRIEGSDLSGRQDLATQIGLTVPAAHQRLEPGESLRLAIDVWPKQKGLLPPREVRICLAAVHAFGATSTCVAPDAVPVTIPIGPWCWQNVLPLVLGALALIVGAVVLLFRRSRRNALAHPAVRAALAGQNPFQGASLAMLSPIAAALRRAARFSRPPDIDRSTLVRAGISATNLRRALQAATSPAACARALAASIEDKPRLQASLRYENVDLAVYALSFPPMSIHIPANSVLILSKSSLSLQTAIARCKPIDLGAPKFAILVAKDRAEKKPQILELEVREYHPGTTFIIISEEYLVQILLARDELAARELLRRAIIEQVDIRQIIPYRDGGNEIPAGDSSFFFGRRTELERMLQYNERNFIVVGPRTMGKSSLLNALKWELERRYPSLHVLKHQLYSGSLQSLHTADPAIRAESPQIFYESVMSRSSHHQIFLLDEADFFISDESKNQYPFCNVMRALSGQRRASFVLAGYKDLYEATQIPDNPLRNFGEILRLDPLDPSSAERMILEPLSALEIQFLDEHEVVDWLRGQTGCRPHLLAILCSMIANLRPPGNRSPLGLEEIKKEVLSAQMLHTAFGRWDGGAIQPLDRVLVRLALLAGSPRHEDLLASLHSHGIVLADGDFEKSLTRLYSWHYALIEDPSGRLQCPVALFQYWLTEPKRNFVPGREWNSEEERLRSELERDLVELRSRTLFPQMGMEGAADAKPHKI